MFLRKPSSSGVSWAEETCRGQFQGVILKNQITKVALPAPAIAHNSDSIVPYKSFFFFFFYTFGRLLLHTEKGHRECPILFSHLISACQVTPGHNYALFFKINVCFLFKLHC